MEYQSTRELILNHFIKSKFTVMKKKRSSTLQVMLSDCRSSDERFQIFYALNVCVAWSDS